jgi:hypothetical protein
MDQTAVKFLLPDLQLGENQVWPLIGSFRKSHVTIPET